ncbi:hypothetical protein [Jannaschia sp. M317]|uniref:hypothetical protein n=1 Tax=Jannaschia sp. M317 TaxID=2867011 RepID=UPI0021A5D37B|nr:hypothetical protein [Jannaschia sp. M317]UWQ16169.1 hypothetical protein K3551_09480 [Jannaschia sp. M317]
MKAVLPEGTNPKPLWQEVAEHWDANDQTAERDRKLDPWRLAPMVPTDLFAAVGYLSKVSGLIGFFDPSPYRTDNEQCEFTLTKEQRKAADQAASAWREESAQGVPPEFVQELWECLLDCWGKDITSGSYLETGEGPPDWWRTALLLVMIADMACNRILRDPLRVYGVGPFEDWMKLLYQTTLNRSDVTGSGEHHDRPPPSLGIMADSSVVCVLPKVRVSPVGATMRNVSRNLSLLPGRSEVRCFWETPINVAPAESSDSLDILLIPEPRKISAADFIESGFTENQDPDRHYWMKDWSTFRINQTWITKGAARDRFLNLCELLITRAKKESRTINGVILPEYALDWDTFQKLCERLKEKEPSLDFVISGTSEDCNHRHGNHVMTRIWYIGEDVELTQSRRKHHRWRMDRSQVENYALTGALNPRIKNWWEDTPLTQRQVHFQRFRERSVFAVLICEELARSEPCHDILRSVAPNLIFALLLDGPQIKQRWPAQYASNLADDPGSAVLTFTSYGLIDRANEQGHHTANRSIALWKDDTGRVVEIGMPQGGEMAGVVLSLWSDQVIDRTITGKQSEALSWRYASHVPVTVSLGS